MRDTDGYGRCPVTGKGRDTERGRRKWRRSPSWAGAAQPKRRCDNWLARAERKRLARLAWKR
eukprot:1097396-Prymnesium_polylepis.1